VGYRKPDGSAFWELNVAAGGSVEIHTHYADTPDFGGAWKFVVSTETNPAFIDDNNLPTFPPFSVVASVTENRDPTTAEVPDFLLTVQGGSFRLLDPPDEQRILISDLFFELQAVPEPGTMLLVGTGLLGAGWLRRKQKSRRS
jgi:hypothetical protein